ncbi:ATP-binding protein [Modestobacter sp. SSW1-42]|uniref:ATP-binding protein n=1 Tax=Modestobacter sp. SSW1-42 TaxID=596372 RepID=UPI0039877BA6
MSLVPLSQTDLAVLVERLRSHGTDSLDIEAKASTRALPKSVRETLSSFSNESGGTILLGLAEDEGFAAVGVDDAGKVRDDLASLCADGMEPPVRAEIEIVTFEGAQLVVAVVPEMPRNQKPCYVKEQGLYLGSYTRSGDGDRHLTQYEVGVLLANRGQPRDDAEGVPEADITDLDAAAIDRLLTRVRLRQPIAFGSVSDEVALTRLRVLVRSGDRLVPSIGGLLALGSYPQQFFPQLHVTFVSIPAKSKDQVPAGGPRFLDNQTIAGSIPVMVAETLRIITRNMSTRVSVTGAGRRDTFEYPLEALREAVVNALLHRDYSAGARGTQVQIEMYQDRLMIRNPGGLFGTVTENDLGEEGISSSRNSYLSTLLMDTYMPGGELLVAENRGSGIPAMLATLRQAGMTTPVFTSRISGFTVVFPKHSLLDAETVTWLHSLGTGLTEAQCMALALMREGRTVTNSSLRQLGLDSREATTTLVDLVERGLARTWGGRRYAQYALTETSSREVTDPDAGPLLDPVADEPIVSTRRDGRLSLAARLEQVRRLFKPGIELSAAEVAVALGDVGERSAITYLRELITAGTIEATAPPKSTLRRYRLRDEKPHD